MGKSWVSLWVYIHGRGFIPWLPGGAKAGDSAAKVWTDPLCSMER